MEIEAVALEAKAKAEADEFEENVKAIQKGLDAVDAGRVRPFQEFFAVSRRRYPNGAGSENHVLKDTAIERGR